VLEHNDLFLMPVWRTIGKSRWLVEARQLPWTITVAIALVVVATFLSLWPADFEVSGKGKLRPSVRSEVFADVDGEVVEIFTEHGKDVKKGDPLVRMTNTDLDYQIVEAQGKLDEANQELAAVRQQITRGGLKPSDEFEWKGREQTLLEKLKSAGLQLALLNQKKQKLIVTSPIDGQVTTWQVRDMLIHRPVKKGQIILTVVEPRGDWELELQMPENDMGFVNEAQATLGPKLPVEYITATNPGGKHNGIVKEVHRSAEVRGEAGNTVLIEVAIEKNDVPDRRPGAGVTGKVYCGRASIGYVWFHDLVSFAQRFWFKIF
jgi:hypothetical protein